MEKLLILFLLVAGGVEAKHLGTFGHTFEIIEEDLLEAIQAKLKNLEASGSLLDHQLKIQEKMLASIQRPVSVEGIVKTQKPRIFRYDPSIRVPYDLKDTQGKVFVKTGTVVNPLDTYSLRHAFVFIDGDDKDQVQWAIKEGNANTKIILVKGSPFELMDSHLMDFYFDQGGKLIKKFGIAQVPARVSQEAKLLKVEEILLGAE